MDVPVRGNGIREGTTKKLGLGTCGGGARIYVGVGFSFEYA